MRPLRTAVVVASLLAVCVLAFEYGFRPGPTGRWVARMLEVLLFGFYTAHSTIRLIRSADRRQHLRSVWYEFLVVLLVVAVLAGLAFSDLDGADKLHHAVLAVQLGIFLFLLIRVTELFRLMGTSRFRPAQLFVTSFLVLIALGTGLLMLPAATGQWLRVDDGESVTTLRGNVVRHTDAGLWFQSGQGYRFVPASRITELGKAGSAEWSTALFTATSSVCVTGLIVESTAGYWSHFGQTVILVLIQLGGLGIMTFGAVFAMLLWQSLGFRHSAVLKDMISPTMSIQVGRVLVFILASTLLLEALGVWSLWGMWDEPGMTGGQRLFYSVFHAVSAFCNAGFCLYDNSLVAYRNTVRANLVFPLLIIIGGLGFMVTYNLSRIGRYGLGRIRHRLRGRVAKPQLGRRKLTLQTKLVFVTSAVLLAVGVILIFLFETMPNASQVGTLGQERPFMAEAAPANRLAHAWFLSVTARTAGFNTVPTKELTDSTKFLTVVLMFIGASPGSTGGGIKTVTLAVVMCGIWSLLCNRPSPQAFRRTIPQNILIRALVIATMSAGLVVVATMVLSVSQANISFLEALFEATSAFGTVGLSTGATGTLNLLGRLLIITVMFAGRVGPLTLFIALPLGTKRQEYAYAAETVALG